ncbi:MAG: hypothetical protein H6Q48_5271 [Deltaproteobacteria bacterium]|nr:hypothetical protein [Deltaproteobacteria bacterium]
MLGRSEKTPIGLVRLRTSLNLRSIALVVRIFSQRLLSLRRKKARSSSSSASRQATALG